VSRQRNAGSTHSGTTDWLIQRVTALYLGAFTLFIGLRFALYPFADHAQFKLWFASGAVRLAWGLFFLSLLWHAWIGMRSVYLDYLKPLWVRTAISMVTAIALFALALWSADILLRAAM
jgi:succinate dehydrogenase / fumarate reductase, membrane anchor subunit